MAFTTGLALTTGLTFTTGLAFATGLTFTSLVGLGELIQRIGLSSDFVASLLLFASQLGNRLGDVAIAADLLFAGCQAGGCAFERSLDILLRLRSAGRIVGLGALRTLLGGVLALSQCRGSTRIDRSGLTRQLARLAGFPGELFTLLAREIFDRFFKLFDGLFERLGHLALRFGGRLVVARLNLLLGFARLLLCPAQRLRRLGRGLGRETTGFV